MNPIKQWMQQQGWSPFPFQEACWEAYKKGESGLLNAPTGSGKTFALWLPCLAQYMAEYPHDWQKPRKNGLRVLWITPLRALTRDIARAMEESLAALGLPWEVGMRTGDTSASEKEKLRRRLPECLLTTPESLHLMLAQKGYAGLFDQLQCVVVDEWHELLGTKRGVQVELGLSRLRALRKGLRVWGISATIGNLEQAAKTLHPNTAYQIIKADIRKSLKATTLLPKEKLPWVGHLGIGMLPQAVSIIKQSSTTLLFTNTRAQTEIWYQKLLEHCPDLAGAMAMHHASLHKEVRDWVEDALHQGILQVVVCTSSLDLGVDFRPVETVIQVGSPKGVARFMQRAGRSGHRPGAQSQIYFLPTNALELAEAAALRTASQMLSEAGGAQHLESKLPISQAFDVLLQYLVTLAVSDGFEGEWLWEEVKSTHSFAQMNASEWEWCLDFVSSGGQSLGAYNDFCKVEKEGDFYKVSSKKVAMRHRLSMGTIVSEPLVKVLLQGGGYLGAVEEYFISRLKPGDVFWFAGRSLEFVRLKELEAHVKKSKKKATLIPRWMGGRMPLSSELSALLREKLEKAASLPDPELQALKPLLDVQRQWSAVPARQELLVELLETEDGCHAFFYPFQGRMVHEAMAALLAYRIGLNFPITISMAMNDYGFELLSDQPIPVVQALGEGLLSLENLEEDLSQGINRTEMAKRKFREIAQISGLLFQGYPGQPVRSSHLHANSALLFNMFEQYEPESLLLRQSYAEAKSIQFEWKRLEGALQEMQVQRIVIKRPPHPTPFALPILIDRMRETMSTETMEARLERMQASIEKSLPAEAERLS